MYCSLFLQRAEKTFNDLMENLDSLSVSWDGGEKSITITMEDNKIYAIHRHDSLEEIWLSSPYSGGYHYIFCEERKQWYCKKNQSFFPFFLMEEWKHYYKSLFHF